MFFKMSNSAKAKALINAAIRNEAYSMSGASYVNGMATLAKELGLITHNELADFKTAAYTKAQAAEKAKREQYKLEAEQRKAERAVKAKAAKEGK